VPIHGATIRKRKSGETELSFQQGLSDCHANSEGGDMIVNLTLDGQEQAQHVHIYGDLFRTQYNTQRPASPQLQSQYPMYTVRLSGLVTGEGTLDADIDGSVELDRDVPPVTLHGRVTALQCAPD
jgi:hypothetical protein